MATTSMWISHPGNFLPKTETPEKYKSPARARSFMKGETRKQRVEGKGGTGWKPLG
jgi:hypothetical protein